MAADYETVSQFLRDNQFSGCQRVPPPFGLAIPGNDRQPTADRVFSGGVIGKTVLDVGTYFGYFPYGLLFLVGLAARQLSDGSAGESSTRA